jgi:predicted MPP superfamily phosphohydrolase
MIARLAITFFLVVGFLVLPAIAYLLCHWLMPRRYGRKVGFALAVVIIAFVVYGMTAGFRPLVVRHIEFASADLPAAFDGYRIVQFSDAHVGTLVNHGEGMVQQLIDSINGQAPDMIVFTGDMQNIQPQELIPPMMFMRQLYARDGVYAVLGNHDYDVYQACSDAEKKTNCQLTKDIIGKMGFDLLLNEHRIIHRDSDSIVVAGMENWGVAKRAPKKGDVKKTLNSPFSTLNSQFVLMLQHDPTCWREKILPECNAQLTLSGHTHGGQFSLFGWSPVALAYQEWEGMTYEGSRAIYVSAGAGSLIPFRLNQPREITVITLKRKQ